MSVVVAAEPEEVWEYFTRAEAMVTWMGHYALLDARPGGELAIDVNESQIRGQYEELHPPSRLVVRWGFAGSRELPPGTSTVEVRLSKVDEGTRVRCHPQRTPLGRTRQTRSGLARFSRAVG
jgi:uncharacterized protein YndB with AHSA1/START domain